MNKKLIVAAVLACVSVAAQATVIVDKSPDTTGFVSGFTASNIANAQNFLIGFTLGSATTLTGFDIYSSCNLIGCGIAAGSPVVIKFTADLGGAPDFANIQSFATTLSAVDSLGSTANSSLQRYHADVTLPVAAGAYWFGLAGDEIQLGLDLGSNPVAPIWILSGDNAAFDGSPFYSVGFNVYADTGAVPEPAAWAMLIAGFGLTGAAMRRRRSTAVAA